MKDPLLPEDRLPHDGTPPGTAAALSREHWCNLMADAIVCLDEHRRIHFFNQAAGKMFESEFPLTLGKPAEHHPQLHGLLEELHLQAFAGAGTHRALRHAKLQHTGVARPVEVSVTVSGAPGERVFTLVIREVQRPGPDQHKLYLAQKQQVIGALAGGVAHDFNNLLTAIICRLELALADERLHEETRIWLTQALDSARRGGELNTKLLSFSRHAETKPSSVNVARLAEEAAFILRRTIDRRIQVQFQPPVDEAWPVLADADQFRQALMNLCLNARDAMPDGGELTLRCANRHLDETLVHPPQRAGDFVQITVADTGCGIPPELLTRLLEPYFTTKEFGKGAGLGLTIANHVVVEHGGWMEVDSQPGQGSQFHVFLPRARSATAGPGKLSGRHSGLGGSRLLDGRETILLVDDEHPFRSVMRAMLAFRGYTVLEAVDGAEAVQRYRDAQSQIDLILLDLQMPRMNGWDTLDKILEINPAARVLLLSGGQTDPPPGRASADQANGIISKPFDTVVMLRTLREILDKPGPGNRRSPGPLPPESGK